MALKDVTKLKERAIKSVPSQTTRRLQSFFSEFVPLDFHDLSNKCLFFYPYWFPALLAITSTITSHMSLNLLYVGFHSY